MSIASKTANDRSEWESIFTRWSQPPSKTEQDRCESTIKQISRAIADHPKLSSKNITTFVQGSFANRVNVRKDSDVDLCCFYSGVFFYAIPDGYDKSFFGLNKLSTYTYKQYKNEIEEALVTRFQRQNVSRGNKAFDVNEEGYRVDADVVPTFQYREYFIDVGGYSYHEGTALIADNGQSRFTNFPNQQYTNGVEKNTATGKRYKKLVRIQKSLCNRMLDRNLKTASPISSFLLESLCWNAPNICYGHATLFGDFKAVTKWALERTRTEFDANLLSEANGIKPLFGAHNPCSVHQVREYLREIWSITNGQL